MGRWRGRSCRGTSAPIPRISRVRIPGPCNYDQASGRNVFRRYRGHYRLPTVRHRIRSCPRSNSPGRASERPASSSGVGARSARAAAEVRTRAAAARVLVISACFIGISFSSRRGENSTAHRKTKRTIQRWLIAFGRNFASNQRRLPREPGRPPDERPPRVMRRTSTSSS